MSDQFLARQVERNIAPQLAPMVIGEELCGPGCIAEDDIPYVQSHGLVVLCQHGPAADRKENEIMICAVESNIAIVALHSTGITSGSQGLEPVDIDRAYPTRKRIGLDARRIIPAHPRSEERRVGKE